jgi:YD repeat-containing protein
MTKSEKTTVTYVYDSAGRLSSATYPDGTVVGYGSAPAPAAASTPEPVHAALVAVPAPVAAPAQFAAPVTAPAPAPTPAPRVVYCTGCGAPRTSGARFCSRCGKPAT